MEKSVQLKDEVYWVGAIDWNVREFHGYTTSRGSTYNAYLVKGEKTALVDTVKSGFFPEMLSRIEAIPAINDVLKGMGFEVIDPGLSVMYVPGEEDLENCLKLGEKIAGNL